MTTGVIAFLGPSLSAREARALGATRVLPPARAGDVWAALALAPRAIALVDGVFESSPSVWHRELLDALAAGVAVFGGASMGALRAAELWPFGMIGVGEIYAAYREGELLDDGEVALLHGAAEHGFRALSEPLVNVRHDLERARRAGILRREEGRELLRSAKALFYQERTWARVLVTARVSDATRARLKDFPRTDLKASDARACVQAAAAFVKAGAVSPRLDLPLPPSHARQRRLGGRASGPGDSRRALLAGWARSQGLAAPRDPQLEAALVRAGMDADRARRLADDVALEKLALAYASRMVNDGPSQAEAADEERFLRRVTRRRATR